MLSKTSHVLSGLLALTVGIVVGAAVSWALLFGRLETAKPFVDGILNSLLPLLGIVSLGLAIIVPICAWAIQRFLRRASGTVDEVVSEISASVQAVAQKDAPGTALHAERAVLAAAAWYGPIAARRWIVGTALALLLAFGGLAGTALLFRQTVLLVDQNKKLGEQIKLLTDQNTKLDLQTITADAHRRAGLAPELFSILKESAAQLNGKGAAPDKPIELTTELASRIVAFSRSATPYWTIVLDDETRAPKRDDRARSPERGQLLAGLVIVGASIPPLVKKGAMFAGADLRDAYLREAILDTIDLEEADLRGVDMFGARLSFAYLARADLGCIYDRGPLFGRCATLSGANLRGARFYEAKLNEISLRDAYVGCDSEENPLVRKCTSFADASFGDSPNLENLHSDNAEMLTKVWGADKLPAGWRFDGPRVRKRE